MTHPGVGTLTALAYELVIGTPERFPCRKQLASHIGRVPEENPAGSAASGTHQQARQRAAAVSVGGSGARHSAQSAGVVQQVLFTSPCGVDAAPSPSFSSGQNPCGAWDLK